MEEHKELPQSVSHSHTTSRLHKNHKVKSGVREDPRFKIQASRLKTQDKKRRLRLFNMRAVPAAKCLCIPIKFTRTSRTCIQILQSLFHTNCPLNIYKNAGFLHALCLNNRFSIHDFLILCITQRVFTLVCTESECVCSRQVHAGF